MKPPPQKKSGTTRRNFLKDTTGVAAGAAMLAEITRGTRAAEPNPNPLLPTIKLGSHDVTRLIIGGNPIYGHSHFNRVFSQAMVNWHTPENVLKLLRDVAARGINTWQNSYTERTLSDLDRHRAEGGKLNWLCLGKPDWDQSPELIAAAAKRKPIGIAPHGALAERLHREGKLAVLTDLLKRIRDTGALVGLSAHNPAVIALSEEKGWDVDYYMCCLYYLTRPRDEFQKLLGGDLPLGEIYLPSDPPRMFEVIKRVRKPCLAYKILAAGRQVENSAQVRTSFETAFANIKSTDAVIVGMWQQFSDQVGENSALVREICGQK
jgi:hypothetical protein